MTVEQLITEAASRGLHINNLFELPGGGWQANVRTFEEEPAFYEFGTGVSPSSALEDALGKAPHQKQSTDIFG